MEQFKRPAFIGYLILVLLVAGAFWYQGQLAERLKEEEVIRAHNLCVNQNELRSIVSSILEDARRQVSNSVTRDEEQIEESLEFYDTAIGRLEPKECPPPPTSILEEQEEELIRPTVSPLQ